MAGFLLLAALSPRARAQALVPATKTEWKRIKKALPAYLWLPAGKRRQQQDVDAAWKARGYDRVSLTRKQFAELGEILRAGSPYTTERKKSATLSIRTGAGDETMPVRVAVTSKYKPGCGRSFPLIITCHGGPMSELRTAESAAGQQFRLWSGLSGTLECIVAAPALTGSRYAEREWTFLTNLIAELDRRYNVDRDRILLTGHSWGGILTWHIGPPHADTFALLAPFVCAVNPGREHLSNCRALPIYHVQGSRDNKWMLETGRGRRKLLDDLGYEHFYREKKGGHEQSGGEVAKIAKLFADRKRELYAPTLVRRPGRGGGARSDFWYWIRSGGRSFSATCDRAGQSIETDIAGAFEVLLADELLDLDKEIQILRNGEVVWRGKVKRSLAFALAHVRETSDRARVFAASVVVE